VLILSVTPLSQICALLGEALKCKLLRKDGKQVSDGLSEDGVIPLLTLEVCCLFQLPDLRVVFRELNIKIDFLDKILPSG